jgi:hypothetical protein
MGSNNLAIWQELLRIQWLEIFEERWLHRDEPSTGATWSSFGMELCRSVVAIGKVGETHVREWIWR